MADERLPTTPEVLAVGELTLESEGVGGRPADAEGIPGRERADRIRTVLTYAVMFTVAALFFIPFLWSVSTSFRTIADTVQGFSLLPEGSSNSFPLPTVRFTSILIGRAARGRGFRLVGL